MIFPKMNNPIPVLKPSNLSLLAKVAVLSFLVIPVKAQAPPSLSSSGDNLFRGARYCEILFGGPLDIVNQVFPSEVNVMWNGTGGTCPGEDFAALTLEDIRAVHDNQADIIRWNGVRQWLVSEAQTQDRPSNDLTSMNNDSATPIIHRYGPKELIFIQVATVALGDDLIGSVNTQVSFVPANVTRFQTFIWYANTTVYELVSPNCTNIYTMQSLMLGGRSGALGVTGGEAELDTYTISEDDAMTSLGLPEGWIFRSRVLDSDLVITGTNGVTPVLQDVLENSYSQHDEPDATLCPGFVLDEGEDPNDSNDDSPTASPTTSSTLSPTISAAVVSFHPWHYNVMIVPSVVVTIASLMDVLF